MEETGAFGALLKQRRKARDLTQAELADRVGCAPSTIRMIESGERRASRQLAELLADYLDVAPEARAGFVQTARATPAPAPEAVERGTSPPALPASDLPAYLTPLVGRERELAAIEARLGNANAHGAVRLLTLTGPAGVGKTRLAAAVAAGALGQFPDGVYFVPLAPIRDPDGVVATIAAAIGLSSASAAGGSTPSDALKGHLRGKAVLLILDNMEQIIAAGPAVAALLAACPPVKALVTSREPLHVQGEHLFPVPLLALPDLDHLPPLAALPGYSAVALFLERAQEAVPSFALTAGNARAIARICARLDGLPLAIELVAARVTLFSPRALLAKLEAAPDSAAFRLLGDGARDLPERQRTLHAAIGWSYDLLSADEQTLFRRLAVFVGGCTLSAIDAVCATGGASGPHTLTGVSSLLDKSLLQRAPDAEGMEEPRLRLLETIREYALAQLGAQGQEAERVRRAHATYFLALAEDAEPRIAGAEQAVWFGRLARDHDNIQAALSWLLAQGESELAARLAGALGPFWRGHTHPEGLHWLLRVLEQRPQISLAVRSKVLRAAGVLAVGLGDLPQAQALAEENLQVAHALGNTQGIMSALLRLGAVAGERGNWRQAEDACHESLRLAEEAGDVMVQSSAHSFLGETARSMGNFQTAQHHYEASLRLAQNAGNQWNVAVALHNLGKVALGMGDSAGAEAHLRESLRLFQDVGSKGGIAYCLEGLGETAVRRGALDRGSTLLGAADALLKAAGIVLERVEHAGRDAALDQARQGLDPATFKAAREMGHNLTLDQAICYALNGHLV